jgi:hypothetical protein
VFADLSETPYLSHAGCLLSGLGLVGLAVSLFGLRYALHEMARAVPHLPGLAIAFTRLVQAIIRSAAAQAGLTTAIVLIVAGLALMYQGGQRRP